MGSGQQPYGRRRGTGQPGEYTGADDRKENVSRVLGDIFDLQQSFEIFDVIRQARPGNIGAAKLFHILSGAHSHQLVSEMHRALRPGGLVCLAGLTRETQAGDMTIFTQIRALIQRVWPWLAGGCRPVDLRVLLDGAQWQIIAHETVSPRGLASEILIARKI